MKFIALPISHTIVGSSKIGQSLICPHSRFSHILNGLLFGWKPVNVSVTFAVHRTVEGDAVWKSGMVPFERALMCSYSEDCTILARVVLA